MIKQFAIQRLIATVGSLQRQGLQKPELIAMLEGITAQLRSEQAGKQQAQDTKQAQDQQQEAQTD